MISVPYFKEYSEFYQFIVAVFNFIFILSLFLGSVKKKRDEGPIS